MSDNYDSYFDYDNDGKYDDYETFMKEDDDDYFYHKTYGDPVKSSSSYHAPKGNGGGLSAWQSILYGLIKRDTMCSFFCVLNRKTKIVADSL